MDFPGEGKVWSLWVADKSAPVWEAVADIMADVPYLFRESAGGTYAEREPGSTSLHTYALALDLNPKKNPMKPPPLVYDYPPEFIERMEGIRASGEQAIMWGGRWPADNPPDTMHWQINVPPDACDDVTYDGGDMALSESDLAKIRSTFVDVLGGDRITWQVEGQDYTRSGNQGVLNSSLWAIYGGTPVVRTIEEIRDDVNKLIADLSK